MSKYNYSWTNYSSPLSVKGGIKPSNQVGPFASTWWGKKWIEVLESFNIGQRLTRGKKYARTGQVMDIEILQEKIIALVQGSRRTPYEVVIEFPPWTNKVKKKAIEIICSNGPMLGYIFAGDLPYELEDILKKQNIYLFPNDYKDIHTFCTCPDWSNPCKHIAAVFYLIASELDRDPNIILGLRGLDLEELKNAVHNKKDKKRSRDADKNIEDIQQEMLLTLVDKDERTPKDKCHLKNFWALRQKQINFSAPFITPPINASIIKQLGVPPFWRGKTDFIPYMEKTYSIISSWAIDQASEMPYRPGNESEE